MYESYAWPGAYSFKDEIKLFIRWFKDLFDGLSKKIEDSETRI